MRTPPPLPLAFVALLLLSGEARAQTPDAIALRRALIEQAQEARQRDDHPEALRLAEAAGRIEMTPSLRLFITIEQFVMSRFVAAMGTADLCVREAGLRAVARREEIIVSCTSYLDRIRPLVGRLAVEVPEAPPGVEVRVNDMPVDATLLGFAVPVDPGRVRVVARAPGRVTVEREVEVPAGETVREAIRLELAPAPTPAPQPPPAPIPAPSPVVTVTPPVARPAPSLGARIGAGPPVLTAGAVVFGAAAGVFFALRESSLEGCIVGERTIVCADASRQSQAQSAPTWNTLTNVALATAGVALLGAGVWLTVRLVRPSAPAAIVELRPGVGSFDARVRW